MRHSLKLKKLSRPSDQRMAIINSGAASLVKYGKVKMTQAHAKAVQKAVEKLVSKAKKGDVHSQREAYKVLCDRTLVKALFDMAKARFAERSGGYTRLTKIGIRQGDAATVALLEFVE